MFSEDETTLLYRMKDNPIGFPFMLNDKELDLVVAAVKRERGDEEMQTRRKIRVWIAANFNWFYAMDGGFKAERSEPPYPGDFVQDDTHPFGRVYLALENLVYHLLIRGWSFKKVGKLLNTMMNESSTIKNKYQMTVEEP
jgi:hypothetical protein